MKTKSHGWGVWFKSKSPMASGVMAKNGKKFLRVFVWYCLRILFALLVNGMDIRIARTLINS